MQDEFTVIMRKLDPRIDNQGVINTFKKAGVQQALRVVTDFLLCWGFIYIMYTLSNEVYIISPLCEC